MAGVTTGLMDLLGIAIKTEAWTAAGSHRRTTSLLVTFPVGLLCLRALSRRIACAKWS
jgi:hypothetical protein